MSIQNDINLVSRMKNNRCLLKLPIQILVGDSVADSKPKSESAKGNFTFADSKKKMLFLPMNFEYPIFAPVVDSYAKLPL